MSRRRFRLVTMQGGREFVSSAVLSEEDAHSLLAVDTLLHRAAGWRVTEGLGVVVAQRGDAVRLMSARRFDAASDRNVAEGVHSRRVA